MSAIPIHQFHQADGVKLQVARFEMGANYPGSDTPAHRDDHYLFFVIDQGSAWLFIDFEEVNLGARSAFYIAPGQVHEAIHNRQAQGWYLAVETALLPEASRTVLEGRLGVQPVLLLDAPTARQCGDLLRLLLARRAMGPQTLLQSQATALLLQAFVSLIADGYARVLPATSAAPRAQHLTHAFKQLLAADFRTQRRPAAYAARLHVSANYLNEVISKTTGFSVSYWITHQVLLEAKRLLVHTSLGVQEIAYALGFPDASYFARLFRQKEGLSPVVFRAKNRE